MANREIFMVKGASASGKSTRYLYLIRFFESIGYNYRVEYFTNIKGDTEKIGIVFDDFNLFFLGRISDKTGLWRGMDDSLDIFLKIDYLFEFIKEKMNHYSFCVEGSSVTRSNRFRPLYFRDYLEADSAIIQYYNFETKQEFIERKFIRSGKVGDNGWDVNDAFLRDLNKSYSEMEDLGIDLDLYSDNFDAPVYDIGVKILNRIGAEFLVEIFIEFCNKTFIPK